MAGAKETPRQKMIGMMYLVLLALLAMNVSKEVLNSFILIDEALTNTNKNYAGKVDGTYSEFEKQMSVDPVKTRPWYTKASTVKQIADETVKYIQDLKREVIWKTDGLEAEYASYEEVPDSLWLLKNIKNKDNYDAPTELLVGPEATAPREGEYSAVELKGKLQAFKDACEKALGPKGQQEVSIPMKFESSKNASGVVENWESTNFYHIPQAAVVTNLSRFEAEVRNAEADVMNWLLSNISAADFKFDTLAVKVLPNTDYVVLGDSFKADVIVAAYSTTQNPRLTVGKDIDTTGTMDEWGIVDAVDTARVHIKDGVASYKYKPTSEGEVTWGGFIQMLKPGSEDEYVKYPFKHSFIVAKPSLVVSPTKMNVFYRGLENPVDISVSGMASSKLQATMSNGSLSKKPDGTYIAKPGSGDKCIISVSAKMDDGSTKTFGTMEFRVKRVPPPAPKIAGVGPEGGKVSKVQMQNVNKVFATMEDFLFDLRFNVVSFELLAYYQGTPRVLKSNNANFTNEMQQIINQQRPGNRLFFQNIFAVGPDGVKNNIGGVNIVIQ